MKPIGLIGGLTYVSTLEYYRHLNELANKKLGGSEAAEIILYSVNFGKIKELTLAGEWGRIAEIISRAAGIIEKAGASCILIGANTMHKIFDEIQASVQIPVLHIAEAVSEEILQAGLKTVGLLGTKYTMQLGFYTDYLKRKGIKTIIPLQEDAEFVNDSIYTEFSKNIFTPETRKRYLEIIDKLQQEGAEGIIMGCTEIPILLNQSNTPIPLFDTAKIHSMAAIRFALEDIPFS